MAGCKNVVQRQLYQAHASNHSCLISTDLATNLLRGFSVSSGRVPVPSRSEIANASVAIIIVSTALAVTNQEIAKANPNDEETSMIHLWTRNILCALGLFIAALPCPCKGINLTEIARFNIDSTANPINPEFLGSNPSAVAWTGSRLFVAGFNNSGDIQDTALIEITNANNLGLVAPTFSSPLQTIFSANSRGYISLDASADGNSLAVAYDDGQEFSEGFQAYDLNTGQQRWNFNARGSSGAAFDPGFQGIDAGAAFGQFGNGRRLLHDTTTGNIIYDAVDGMIWYDNVGGTFVRDMDFDPDTGDIYVRHNNQLSRATRTGGNSVTPNGIIVGLTDAPFVSHQNLSFLNNTSEGDLIVFNDRPNASAGQEFLDTVLVVDTNGNNVSSTFSFLNGATPISGAGWYDFDFDPVSQTLAVVDNSNRNIHIFEVGGMSTLACDFSGDGICDGMDIDMLVENIAVGPPDPNTYDLTNDGTVNNADRDRWLELAGAENLPSGNAYLLGDANLDGSVDGQDFILWNDNKFTATAMWTVGDFTADGVVDGQDFVLWNDNKFTSADGVAVPEPSSWALLILHGLMLTRRRRNL